MTKKCVTCGKLVRKGKNKKSMKHCSLHQPTINSLSSPKIQSLKTKSVLEQMGVNNIFDAEIKLRKEMESQVTEPVHNRRMVHYEKIRDQVRKIREEGWFEQCGDKVTVPAVWRNAGKDYSQWMKNMLEDNGLPRTSNLTGGEITGITQAGGSTGFSIRNGRLKYNSVTETWDTMKGVTMNVVVSGKPAGVRYIDVTEYDDDRDMHKPDVQDLEKVASKIQSLFESHGFTNVSVKNTGYQMHWDDDLDFCVESDVW